MPEQTEHPKAEREAGFFSMDEALGVVFSTEAMTSILGFTDQDRLRIRLGQLFGLQVLRLRVSTDSNRSRTYWSP